MGEVVTLPVIRVESDGLLDQEERRRRIERGFPLADDAASPGPSVLTASRRRRRMRRSLIGDDVA